MTTRNIIRSIYFYAASLITLIMMVVSTGQLVDTALKAWVFPKAELAYKTPCDYDEFGNVYYSYEPRPAMIPEPPKEGEPERRKLSEEERASLKSKCEANQKEQRSSERQNNVVRNLSMLLVAAPVFWFHFRIAQRERREELDKKS